MLNHVALQGRLVRDPDLRRTASGTAVASFTLAVDRDVAARDSTRKTDFIDCIAWRGAGEFVKEYFHKGSAAVVSGRLELRDWTDKNGTKRRSAEVNVASIYFGESKKGAGANANSGADVADSVNGAGVFVDLPDDDSDLPF